LENPPQELMRRWGRLPIYKASIPDQRAGDSDPCNRARKERKEVILSAEADLRGSRVERTISRREKSACNSLVPRRTEKQAHSGCKKLLAHFQSKLINEVEE
jgi:5S rRNA maturation endonuclease (ribonuclease M5)